MQIVFLAFADLNQALAAKQIDAMCQSEPQSSQALNKKFGVEVMKPYTTKMGEPVRLLVMTGNGVHALQEGGYLGSTAVRLLGKEWSGVPMLGLHPSWQVVLAQCVVVLLLVVPSLLEWSRRRRDNPTVLPGASSQAV